ncbi:RNA-binding protein 14-like [Pararge aegeria]|uniref:RNA-binding protein 14-like n=1 Tax=Pararge aegeria TaxID=116150 RepID=UPI0019D04FB4|nr:RNA-binding protein 14-like [Pararge aegeria]
MYTKVVIFMCAAGIASAGNLLHAAPVAYSSPVSSVSYSSQTTAHAAPLAYAAAPVVTKTLSPAVSYQTISTHSSPAVATYSAPAVAAYSTPYVTKTIAAPSVYASAPVSYSSVAHPAVSYSSVAHAGPVATYAAAPAYTTYAAAAPAYSTYAAAPLVKSAITYSAAPAVSHVSYSGLGASYGCICSSIEIHSNHNNKRANMYTKVVIFMCAAGIASAGNLLHAAPVAYSSPVSSVSYSSQTTAHAAPLAYAAAPVVTKTLSPAVSYQTISTHSSPAVATYSAPAVAAYSTPYVTKTIAAPSVYASAPVSYSSVAHPAVSYSSVAHAAPVATYAAAPAYTTYAAAAPAYSTYAAAPLVKSAITYSAAPAVSHVSYSGLGATYGCTGDKKYPAEFEEGSWRIVVELYNYTTQLYKITGVAHRLARTNIAREIDGANMYTKVVIFMCAAGIASAGNLLHAAPVAYSSPVSSVSYSSQTTAHAAPLAYAAAPVVTKTLSPAVSYQTISTHSSPAVAAYSAPAVAAYSTPYVTKTVAAPSVYASGPVSYSSVAHPAVSYSSVAHAGPVATYAAAPAYTTYAAAAPAYTSYAAAAPAYSTYAAAPIVKSAITYSAAPAVSHVSYSGLGATYGW